MYFQKIGSGKPIVFLHGWGCDGSIFRAVAEKLPNNKCFLVDFNGFGKSPAPPAEGWGVEDYAMVLSVFFRQHNLKNVLIVAHSFGCRVAMVLAAKYPALAGKMILVAPAGLRKFSFSRWLKVRKYKFVKFLCRLNMCRNVSERYGSVDYNACENGLKNTFVKVVNQDLSRFAKQIRCPVLIVNGRDDKETPLASAQKLQKLIPNAVLTEIDGGHFAFFETPFAFAKTITYFSESGK